MLHDSACLITGLESLQPDGAHDLLHNRSVHVVNAKWKDETDFLPSLSACQEVFTVDPDSENSGRSYEFAILRSAAAWASSAADHADSACAMARQDSFPSHVYFMQVA